MKFSFIMLSAFFAITANLEATEPQQDKELQEGKKLYQLCATCHKANGWGEVDGSFPVIAGQHKSVIIKQLEDIRARNRDNPTMFPFSGDDVLGGTQSIENVASYIAQLDDAPDTGHGKGDKLEQGEKLYNDNCSACHGKRGGGNAQSFFPRIQGQHYAYLKRQLIWIRDGRRKNGNPAMLEIIKKMDDQSFSAIADYVSRL